MSKAKVVFFKCLQDSQELGSNDEHMVSRVFFTLEIDGQSFVNLYANLKQTVGDDYETGSIEVSQPQGYSGPLNYEAFSNAAVKYYRSLVGSQGRVIRVEGSRNARMRNNTFMRMMEVEFDIGKSDTSW